MSVVDGDIISVVIEALLEEGTTVQNRKRFKVSAAGSITDALVLIAIDTWVETLYGFIASQIPLGTQLQQGVVDKIAWNATEGRWETTANIGTYSPLDSFANNSEPLPNQVSAFVVGHTSRPKTKGRMFAFPFGEDQQDTGELVAAAITAMGNFADQYMYDQGSGADSFKSIVVREAANDFRDITSVHYDTVLGTQRRRRKGVGI